MEVVPVIDIKHGQVVHAQGGRRDSYRPIETPLSATSRPADVAVGLLRLAPFRKLYIADLDAIEAGAPNEAAIDAIAQAVPGVELWIDNGLADLAAARAWLDRFRHCLVIGSESQRGPETIHALRDETRVLLSLDFRGDVFQGPILLRDEPGLWPARVIVMTLARVGAGGGPDTQRIADIVTRADGRAIFGAGGIRDRGDLSSLATVGAAGVLVATALHTGALTSAELRMFTSGAAD